MIPADAATRRRILDSYEAARPTTIEAYHAWIEVAAEENDLSVKTIQRIVTDQAQSFMRSLSRDLRTQSQRVADLLGATITEGIERLRDSLHATKKRPLTDKNGRMVRDGNGKIQFIEVDDWPTIVSAADKLIKLHGGFPAEKFEVERTTYHVDLTKEQALERFEQLYSRIDGLRAQLRGTVENPRRVGGGGTAVNSGNGRPGHLLLDDPLHQDQGRAGSGEPVQAFSRQDVPPAAAGIPRTLPKPRKVHQKKPHDDG